MGVIYMQMYNSTAGKGSDVSSRSPRDYTSGSELSSDAASHSSHFDRRQASRTNMFGEFHHQRTSSHASEGRPPRHPDSPVSKCRDVLNSPMSVLNTHFLEDYINEKFPTEILAQFELNDNNINEGCTMLSDEAFCSLLGTADELNDDIVFRKSYFECLDVWS